MAALALMVVTNAHAAYGHHRPVLGVGVTSLDFNELDKMELSYGVRVFGVKPRSPAEQAGIKVGDIITAIDGEAVFSPSRLQWLTGQIRDKKEAMVSLHCDGKTSDVRVDISKMTGGYEKGDKAAGGRSFIGIGMQPMNSVMRKAFGSPPELGVLVTEVLQDSPAVKAGIQQGDVIVGLAGKSVDDLSDVYRALNYFEPGETLSLKIYREKQEMSLEITLDSMPRSWWGHGMHNPHKGSHYGHHMMHPYFPGQMPVR